MTDGANQTTAEQRRIAELEAALRPFAFLDATDIRWIWTEAPDFLPELSGQVVAVVSGPWMAHQRTPNMTGSVKRAREVLGHDR